MIVAKRSHWSTGRAREGALRRASLLSRPSQRPDSSPAIQGAVTGEVEAGEFNCLYVYILQILKVECSSPRDEE